MTVQAKKERWELFVTPNDLDIRPEGLDYPSEAMREAISIYHKPKIQLFKDIGNTTPDPEATERCWQHVIDLAAGIVADHNALIDVPREEVEKGIVGEMIGFIDWVCTPSPFVPCKISGPDLLDRMEGGK